MKRFEFDGKQLTEKEYEEVIEFYVRKALNDLLFKEAMKQINKVFKKDLRKMDAKTSQRVINNQRDNQNGSSPLSEMPSEQIKQEIDNDYKEETSQ